MILETKRSTDEGWDIPKRYLRIKIIKGSSELLNVLTEEMRVKFNTTAAVTGAMTEANIVISGIKVDNMFTVSTSTTQWIKNWVQNHIIIEAGTYKNHAKIFEGTIMQAQPDLTSADYTITIKAMTGFGTITEPKSYSFAGTVPVSTIARQLANDNGLAFVDGIKDDSIRITDFTARETSLVEITRELANATGTDIYVQNGRMYLKRQGDVLKNNGTLVIRSEEIVGIVEPNQLGCNVKVRMNVGARTGMQVKLNSIRYPILNAQNYYLQTISHSGDTFGADWYTTLELVKLGLGFRK
jgi:hypothetical protein